LYILLAKISFPDKSIFTGEFKNDEFTMFGKFIDKIGNEFEALPGEDEKEPSGSFKFGSLNGFV